MLLNRNWPGTSMDQHERRKEPVVHGNYFALMHDSPEQWGLSSATGWVKPRIITMQTK